MSVTVRPATSDDVPAILRLIKALATYEREPHAVRATHETLMHTFFSDDAHVFAHVADKAGEVVGTTVWFLNYSTWTGRSGLYLEDLFVSENARDRGVGRALFRALAREAIARGCARIDWAVLDWNTPAMAFYRAIGGRRMSGWEPWRLDGEGLEALAR